jgi:tetratricopeptide (TPR) repeat protein
VLLREARAALERGDVASARAVARRAVAADPNSDEAHALVAELTGASTVALPDTMGPALSLAKEHPYDTRVLVRAGELVARSGDEDTAVAFFEKVVWLGDVDPAATARALRRLAALRERWARLRAIPVHVFADEPVRAAAGWRFRLRTLWMLASNALEETVGVRFVPVAMGPFRSAEAKPGLADVFAAFLSELDPEPEHGILAAFTGRTPTWPLGPGEEGAARFLGRHLVVRLVAGRPEGITLAHELLHLFGAVHARGSASSLMHPEGSTLRLDAINHRIVRSTRRRQFSAGSVGENVLPWIDRGAAIEAYTDALRLGAPLEAIGLRRDGDGRFQRGPEPARAGPDPELGDVARLLAALLRAEGRPDEALLLLAAAADLYGPGSDQAQVVFDQAEGLLGAKLSDERAEPSP